MEIAPPRKLAKGDDRGGFSSGAAELDEWFRRFALENQQANNATTYVAVDGDAVAGFYSIAVAAVEKAESPLKFQRRSDPQWIPCILLARLAVDEKYQGQGIGTGLLRDALTRAAVVSDSVGARAVLIHARDQAAKAFYANATDAYEMPGNPLHLMIPMKWVRAAFQPR